jgi:hypothetical protein
VPQDFSGFFAASDRLSIDVFTRRAQVMVPFMRRLFLVGFAACLALTGCAPSVHMNADGTQMEVTFSVTVPSGLSSKVYFTTSLTSECGFIEMPVVRLAEAPAHGEVEIVQAEEFPGYAASNPRVKCNTLRVKGMRINYKSRAGYAGKDAFTYETFVSGHAAKTQVIVNVL